MTVNSIHGQSSPPAQITGAQSKSGEEAFNQFTESKGYDKGALQEAVSERTRLSRTKRGERAKKNHPSSLFLVSDEGDLEEEVVYRTVMVDGALFTLRLLAVA